MSDVFKVLEMLSKQGRNYLDCKLAEYGINSSQFYYILIICDNEGIPQEKLSGVTHVHPSNVSRALDVLFQKGYILKKNEEVDRRVLKLYPTEKAKAIYKRLKEFENKWADIMTSDFSYIERKNFEELLEKAYNSSSKYLKSQKK